VALQDTDGTSLVTPTAESTGRIKTFTQELRASGQQGRLNWLLGANYEHDSIEDQFLLELRDATNTRIAGIDFFFSRNAGETTADILGLFGNAEYAVTDTLSLQAGARYTRDQRDFNGCTYDVDGGISAIFTLLTSANPPIPQGV